MGKTLRLGLTGGIGSGKSTVARILAQQGAAVIDADAISRTATGPGGPAIASLAAAFGVDFITADQALDRDKMRTLAYADASARKRLEAIVHPLIGLEISRQTDVALQSGSHCIVFDIPLLVESQHWRPKLTHVLVVDCSHEEQIRRVMTRNAMSRQAVEQIIQSQATRLTRVSAADLVIFNDQIDLIELGSEVSQIWRWFELSSQ